MSLGMASPNPTVTRQPSSAGLGHAPSAFRGSPNVAPHDFNTPSPLLPSRAAPAPPGPRRESSLGTVPTQQSLGLTTGHAGISSSGSRFQSKSVTNSPNPNRFSAGTSYPAAMPSNGYSQAGPSPSAGQTPGLPPPRPSRAGTMPLDTNMLNGMANTGPLSPPINRTPGGSPMSHSHYLPAAVPPLPSQSFAQASGSANPYSASGAGGAVTGLPGMAGVEKGMEDVRLSSAQGVGLGMPMAVQEPRDKELPKEPTGRSRSGTGKSTKEKKSVFGFMQGELASSHRFERRQS